MALIFELNTTVPVFVPVTLHGTSNVILYWVWILFVVVTLHQWSGNFFIAAQITFSIATEGPLHLKPLEQNDCITLIQTLNQRWIRTFSLFNYYRNNFKCVGFVRMCSSSDTGNMQRPYNSPGVYLVHVFFSQFVFFSN